MGNTRKLSNQRVFIYIYDAVSKLVYLKTTYYLGWHRVLLRMFCYKMKGNYLEIITGQRFTYYCTNVMYYSLRDIVLYAFIISFIKLYCVSMPTVNPIIKSPSYQVLYAVLNYACGEKLFISRGAKVIFYARKNNYSVT